MKLNIAIIGHGFVGKAVDYGFPSQNCEKYIVDPKHGMDITALPQNMDYIFVCVPTPMGDDGSIDSSIIESVVSYLLTNNKGIIIIKSTVTPEILKQFSDSRVVYNPEFLTEKSANEDFVNPFMHIFGGHPLYTQRVEELYKYYSICKPCPTYHMSTIEASFVKYGINSFLATKVLWFNQFYDIIQKENANYGKIISAITTDSRVGRSHTTVPGFDGKRGYGGSCFPKDTLAFVKYAKSLKNDFSVLEKVIIENNKYRSKYKKDQREMEQNISYDTK